MRLWIWGKFNFIENIWFGVFNINLSEGFCLNLDKAIFEIKWLILGNIIVNSGL